MKNLQTAILLAALILVLPLPKIFSQGTPAGQLPVLGELQEQALKSLISTNRDTRLRAAEQLDNQRKELLDNLIKILDSTDSDNVKSDAVVVIGEYRDEWAVSKLIDHLGMTNDFSGGPHLSGFGVSLEEMEESSPVAWAIIKIGLPAIPRLLDKITQTDDEKTIENCAALCKNIEGLEITQFRLHGLLDKETDPKKKDRIQSALDALKKLYPEK
jgi:hypothetical protein